ncbi:enhancer of mRNA-decapping protein 4-like [Stegodyphus dumicola]|uniref:enhancer of mRNA-decapping protein 4-like n=1 Tax=Stegodyphus dumicola TaxID=202533 RepID=UPI0015B05BC4|nr:enhancer of mRNA-decapping protein 4-like [Stegodyphus dumicola]
MTKEDVEHISNSLSSFTMSGNSGPSQNQQEYLKEWPQAPDPKKEYLISTRSESELKSHNQCFHPNSGDASSTAFDVNVNRSLAKLNQSMGDMLFKLESLIDVVQDQRGEIEGLKSEIKLLQQDRKGTEIADESNLSKKLDLVISQHLIPDYARLENLILKNAEDNRQRSERELVIMSEEVSSTFSKRLESILKQELTSNIVPQINRALDTIAQKMHIDFTQKLTATDTSLRDSFLKYLKGKPFMDFMSQSVGKSLETIVQAACKDAFQTSVVPAFERSCHHLFQQLNEIFSKGISEYIQIVEKRGQICCSAVEAASANLKEEVTKLLGAMQQAVQAQAAQMENRSLELVKQQEVLLSSLRQIMHEEVRKALREQQTSVLNSRCVTPAPHSDPQLQKQHLMQLVKQGNLDEAFQQALSAMDVQLVLFLCEAVTPDQVFSPTPCPLQQHVLLSLVNQLSADLSYKTELKIRYIEDVIASLDSSSPIIREHIRNVLESLQQRIAIFLQNNPNHKLVRNLKRITLAVQSLIKCQ